MFKRNQKVKFVGSSPWIRRGGIYTVELDDGAVLSLIELEGWYFESHDFIKLVPEVKKKLHQYKVAEFLNKK